MITHHDFVGSIRDHCGSRLGELRNDYTNVVELGPQVSNKSLSRFKRTTGAVKNQIKFLALLPMRDFHHALHVFIDDAQQLWGNAGVT